MSLKGSRRGRTRSADNNSEVPLRDTEQHWKRVFDKYDRDHDGRINLMELRDLIDSREYEEDIPDHVVKKIYERADKDGDGVLDLAEFVALIHNPTLEPLFGHIVRRYIGILVPRRGGGGVPFSETDGIYEDEYSCYPPPLGMMIISVVELFLFCLDAARGSASAANGPVATVMIYDPYRRYQSWRYVTYMFVHIGVFHLVVNLCVQVLLGLPLEMVHRWWRVLLIYFAGVIAGSLGTSIADPSVKLAGASGGVYSLITAHIATIVMNWKEMEFPLLQLLIFLIITVCDVGTSIYDRYVLDINEHIGYVAHFAGAVAGLLVGINVLRNLNVTRTERVIWWCSVISYFLLMGVAIVFNLAAPGYFPEQIHDK